MTSESLTGNTSKVQLARMVPVYMTSFESLRKIMSVTMQR